MKYNNPVLIQPSRKLPGWLGIIGAGTIGPDIAYYLKSTLPDLKLVLVDIRQDALDQAVERICSNAEKGRKRGKLTGKQADRVGQNIFVSTEYQALAYCEWVIEAASEDIQLKREIFTRVEAIVSESTIITSNTSSIPAGTLFSHLQHPQRTTVTHFFAPAFRNPAVEIIDWKRADKAMIEYLRWLFYITDKVPMVTEDVVCFMLDRIFDNWCNEAALLLDEAAPAQIDFICSEYVHAGPFFVLNLAHGNPIIVETNSLQAALEGTHYTPAEIFKTVTEWDTIPPGEEVKVGPSLEQKIKDRMLGILFSQSVDILDRHIGKAEDLDLGCRLAFAFKQGPLELMRSIGAEECKRIIKGFSEIKPGMPINHKAISSYTNYQRFILMDELQDVKIITLRRPDAMNALHDEMNDEILRVIQQYENEPGTAGFVITGYGIRAFSAGADIGKFPALLGNRKLSAEYARSCSRLMCYLDKCKKPVVAALNGMALGGGLELAIRCHGIVSVRDAWVQFPEITLGIVPGIGGMVVPYRRWPEASAVFHKMLIKADRLTAEQAADAGMINTLVDEHVNLLPAALWLVRELAEKQYNIRDEAVAIAPIVREINAPLSSQGQPLSAAVIDIMCAAIKAAANADSFDRALEIGYAAFAESACTDASIEGINAFIQGRKANFQASAQDR